MTQTVSYATSADMISRFGEQELIDLTDRAGMGNINNEVLEQALSDATALINGFLSGRYSLPLSPVPAVLVKNCCDLARYSLYEREPTETITKRKADAVRYLELLASGKVTLGLPADSDIESTDLPQFQSAGSVFGRDKSKGFI